MGTVLLVALPGTLLLITLILMAALLTVLALTTLAGPASVVQSGSFTELRDAAHMLGTTAEPPGEPEGHQP